MKEAEQIGYRREKVLNTNLFAAVATSCGKIKLCQNKLVFGWFQTARYNRNNIYTQIIENYSCFEISVLK